MGKRIAESTFARYRYPWDDWTDGSHWRIYRGEDYRISTKNMQISLHGRARMQGMTVKTRSFVEHLQDNHGWIQTREGLVFTFQKDQIVDE